MSNPHRHQDRPDAYAPPEIPTEVFCVYCRAEYESYMLQWHAPAPGVAGLSGWCCPTPGCPGRGYGCDIYPVDAQAAGADSQELAEPLGDQEPGEGDPSEVEPEDELWVEPLSELCEIEIEILTDTPEADPPPPPIELDIEAQWQQAIRRPEQRDDAAQG